MITTLLYDIEKESLAKQPQQAPPGPTEPRIAIIKIPKGVNAKSIQPFIDKIANAIRGHVFVVPINFEVLLGNTAKEELEKIHQHIHKMLDIKEESK